MSVMFAKSIPLAHDFSCVLDGGHGTRNVVLLTLMLYLRAFALVQTGSLHTSGRSYAAAQQELRNILVAPDKQWSRRDANGRQHKIRVFKKADGTIMTLTEAMNERLTEAMQS